MIHGMWGGGWYWDKFKGYFEDKGYNCIAPYLRHHDIKPNDPPPPEIGKTSLLDYATDLELEIKKLCESTADIGIGFNEKQAVVKKENSIMIIRLMNGDFPDYNNIVNIEDEKKYIDIDRMQFLNSMKRMNIFTEDRFNVVKVDIEKNNITLSSQHADIGNAKDELAIKYSGEPFNLFFNGRYFVDVLSVIESKKVKLYIYSEKSPCFIKTEEDPGFLSVIMPMKI